MNEILRQLRDAIKGLRTTGDKSITFSPDQIKRLRGSLGLTQEQFANQLAVSVQAVRSWEQGFRKPGTLSLVMLGILLHEKKKK